MKLKLLTIFCLSLYLILSPSSTYATEILVAVTDSFATPLPELKQKFEKTSTHKLTFIIDTPDQLYTQIKAGKLFDLLLLDDPQTLQQLEQEDYVTPDSRIVYAINKLVLWSQQPYLVDSQGRILITSKFKKLAIPTTIPYSLATQQTLQKLGIWDKLKPKMVKTATLSETYQRIATQKAELGFIVLSQLTKTAEEQSPWSLWVVPTHLYVPLTQSAALLKNSQNKEAAQEFIAFLQRSIARSIIEDFGYEVP
jgi:molybdate transport system substrate-binding protein